MPTSHVKSPGFWARLKNFSKDRSRYELQPQGINHALHKMLNVEKGFELRDGENGVKEAEVCIAP